MMRAFAIDRFGEPGSLRDLPIPEPGPGELLVRVRAAGVNPLDWKIREGAKIAAAIRFPLVLGQDAAGVVEKIGDDVTPFAAGDEVFGAFWLAGSYAQYIRASLSAAAVARKPASIDFVHAAALPTPALAALACLDAAAVKDGQTVLIVGATGGVGSYAIQIAARRGARVIATASGDGAAHVRRLGAAEVIDHRRSDVVAVVKATHPEGIDAVVDVVSDRAALGRMADALRAGGRLATTIHAADEAALAKRGIHATNVDVLATTQGLDEIARLVDGAAITVPLERTYPLTDAARALAESKAGHVRGKVVLTID
jgi:NADPH:quinone reductase-like Zn-dependent oxidoreductase